MFGKNPVMKPDKGDGLTLQVVKGSPWLTIQGEGPYAGHPAVFLRLHGCPLRCFFCDTEFSDPGDPVVHIEEIITHIKQLLPPGIKGMRESLSLVVITGGEPMRQNIFPICEMLHNMGYTIQIETAGVYWIDEINKVAQIVCSPKTPKVHPMISDHALAFKYVIDSEAKFEGMVPVMATQPGARPERLAFPLPGTPVYLSPLDAYDEEKNLKNRQLVAQMALRFHCIAGVQLHKFLGVA